MTNVQLDISQTTAVGDLQFERLNERYKLAQAAVVILRYSAMMAVVLLLLLMDSVWWCVVAEIVLVIAFACNIVMIRRAYLFKGYALREHDITYRSGIIFPKVTTVPYRRIQQVSVRQNPLSKFFRLYSVDVVNGAQDLMSLTIPGLTEDRAMQIKNCVTEKLCNRDD